MPSPKTRAVPDVRLRRALRIRGTVQGVGFRPAVQRLAVALGLGGWIRNEPDAVTLEIEGAPEAVAHFLHDLPRAAPPPARVESICAATVPARGETDFHIAPSIVAPGAGDPRAALIPPDLGPCNDCLRELGDPRDRRYRYPFINCTACGPRFTIVRAAPYDRARTTMDAFLLCDACRREYEDPADRRFHAEPNACPACGPRLEWIAGANAASGEAALAAAVRALGAGAIVAVKGAGGFVLAVDAADERAVARLRTRKRRPDKPLAVLARSLDEARRVAHIDEAAAAALTSPARPIVLVPARPGPGLARGVAPRLDEVGLCLPPTPLQHLLVGDGPPLLVMTSGNVSDEPIARENAEALRRLNAIADGFLLHDREIHTRADDSVLRVIAGAAVPIRRARGLVPDAIPLPPLLDGAAPILALGGTLKDTVCIASGASAVLSQHLGDLDEPDTLRFFEETIEKLGGLVGVAPMSLAHDLHPDYASTRWAQRDGRPRHAVQHHHAHVAACLAEHGLLGPVIGVAFDGTGCGPDGSLWGGEILEADLNDARRLGHLQPLRLPGGETAIRQPWRIAVAALLAAGEPLDLLDGIAPAQLARVRRLVETGLASPEATGAGRWFDAVAALAGLRHTVSYEGQAAMELEAAAAPEPTGPYTFAIDDARPFTVDLRPMVRQLALDLRCAVRVSFVAARFHETMARVIAAACARARALGAPPIVALSGGCFANRRLTERARQFLEHDGFTVLLHRRVPSGDGGLALGQAAVAAFRAKAGGACA
jgi:hydrogenase maturation protein HypF